jgi:16S rRNA (guanine(966)-N(2))-methyltransferase RsmD
VSRITGGVARGRVLREPVPDAVRPTSERVREALFSILGQELSGTTFLDAFGGTGVVGLEAWSRGARATVLEREPRVARGIERRVAALAADVEVRIGDALRIAAGGGTWDVVFADPPWDTDFDAVVAALAPVAQRSLIVEADVRSRVPMPAGFDLDRERTYGRTAMWVFRRSAPDD